MFKLWGEIIIFENGLYAYIEGEDNNSIISHDRANQIEEEYQKYQAMMDIERGGMENEAAYRSRGLNEDGSRLVSYKTDNTPEGEIVTQIEGRWIIPDEIGGKKITAITKRAFLNCRNLSDLVVSKNIEVIEKEAFAGCNNLKNIEFEGQITKIEEDVFVSTALYKNESSWQGQALYINNWLVKVKESYSGNFVVDHNTVGIADNAFEGCTEIREVNMPQSVKYIGDEVFKDCSKLKAVHFPDKVLSFGSNVLQNCINLMEL